MKKISCILMVLLCVSAGAQAADNTPIAKTLSQCAAFMKANEEYAAKGKVTKAAKADHAAAIGMGQAAVILMGKSETSVKFVSDQIIAAKPKMEKLVASKDVAAIKKQTKECDDAHVQAQVAYKAMQKDSAKAK